MPRWLSGASVALLALSLCALAARAEAQSLADVARQEQERRKAVKVASKVYTNEDLRKGRPLTTGAPTPATPPALPPPEGTLPGGATTPAAGAAPPPASPEEPRKDEAYWRARIAAPRAALARNKLFLEALQSRVNALSADFVNRDDPAQKSVIAADRQKALAEMDRVAQDMDRLTKTIAEIEEEARRAGVPPGWLR